MFWKPLDRRTRTAIAVALFAMTEPFVRFPAIGAPPSPPAAPPPTALQRLDGSANAIPTRTEPIDGLDRPLQLPDWDRITFASLPGALEDGSFSAPIAAVRALGYDPSRSWQRGETPDRYLMLGDFEDSLRLQDFSLGDLGQITGTDLGPVALSQFGPARYQTIAHLVETVPGLGDRPIAAVPPVRDAIAQAAPATLQRVNADTETIGEWARSHAEVAEALDLGQLPLDDYAIEELPGLLEVDLSEFDRWREAFIKDIPKLSEVPFSDFPEPLQSAGAIAQIDIAFGPAETDRNQTISGSQQAGFDAPCDRDCAHAELTGSDDLNGKQWISGKHQTVEGGTGVLGEAFDGREPTGRHPFGDAFKIAIWDVDEGRGQVDTALFFRICYRGVPDLGCTPYGIGPIPFLSHHERDPIFVGLLDREGGATTAKSYPQAVETLRDRLGLPTETQLPRLKMTGYGAIGGGLCGSGPGGVDFNAIAAAFSSIEGQYDSLGAFVCDGSGNCGRGLGRYQYMSYRSDVRQRIAAKPGGRAVLQQLDRGAAISKGQLMRVFGETEQNAIFKSDVSRNIEGAQRETDPRTGQPFTGRRLIERIGQRHFGGFGAAIDGGSSDTHGRLTLASYGRELADEYFRQLKLNGESDCGVATGQFVNPAPGFPITSGFGYRRPPCAGCSSFHAALDFGTPMGTPIAAADGGRVIHAGWVSGWGKTVVIDHGNGYQTRYSHLNSLGVSVGDAVAQGDAIARSGMTGLGTGPHLDFAVYRGHWNGGSGKAIDPRSLLQL